MLGWRSLTGLSAPARGESGSEGSAQQPRITCAPPHQGDLDSPRQLRQVCGQPGLARCPERVECTSAPFSLGNHSSTAMEAPVEPLLERGAKGPVVEELAGRRVLGIISLTGRR